MVRRLLRPWTMGAADNLQTIIQVGGDDEGTSEARELPTWRRVSTREHQQQLRLWNNSVTLPPAGGWKLTNTYRQIANKSEMYEYHTWSYTTFHI